MKITLSVVSHGQIDLVQQLLSSIDKYLICEKHEINLIVTQNFPEYNDLISKLSITIKTNLNQRGFGANHNSIFESENPDIFIIINPDIKLIEKLDLDQIITKVKSNRISITSPIIVDKNSNVDDYKRSNLTPINLIKRKIFKKKDTKFDWYAGMFLIVTGESFKKLNGFDERFFMYLEDCDLCVRAQKLGLSVQDITNAKVLHDARRLSRKSFRYFQLHVKSLIKYWWKIFIE